MIKNMLNALKQNDNQNTDTSIETRNDNINEAIAVNVLKHLLDIYKGTNANPKKGSYFATRFEEWLKHIRKEYPSAVEKKILRMYFQVQVWDQDLMPLLSKA